MTWLQTCRDHAAALSLPEESWRVLGAFARGEDGSWSGDFGSLLKSSVLGRRALGERIASELAAEVDGEQAAMFARRFLQVSAHLAELGHAEADLLVVGLSCRVAETLDGAGGRRSVRVRAAIDFFYSQGAVLEHRLRRERDGVRALSLRDLVDGSSWRILRPGIAHARLEGDTAHGPQHIHVATLAAGSARLSVVDAYAGAHRGDFAALAQAHGAVVATSGGYFLYSEADVRPPSRRHDPVGLVLNDGEVLAPAVFRRAAVLQDAQGRFGLEAVGPEQHEVQVDGRWRRVRSDIVARNAASPDGVPGVEVIGDRVMGAGVRRPSLAGLLLTGVEVEGPSVRWRMAEGRWRSGLSGGPFLLRDGAVGYDLPAEEFRGDAPPQTFSGDETGDRNLLPRMGVGLRPDGTLVLVAVDGRNLRRALGLTLAGVGELLRELGCGRGMNLDGGSSKRMAIEGRVVDLPTTEIVTTGAKGQPVRPVHTALLFV